VLAVNWFIIVRQSLLINTVKSVYLFTVVAITVVNKLDITK